MASQQGKAKRSGFNASGHTKRGSKTPSTPSTHAAINNAPVQTQNGTNGRSAASSPAPTSSAPPVNAWTAKALLNQLKPQVPASEPESTPIAPAKPSPIVSVPTSSAAATTAKGKDSFRTDVDITGVRVEADSSSNGRQLRRWADEVEESEALESSPSTFGKPVNNTTTSTGGNKNAWDQFKTNERLFGAKTDYDEEIYTTKLDRSAKDFKERERKANALAQQILSGTTSNPHIAEERGQAIAESHLDEEDKYSGVIRTPGAYVPPGARKVTDTRSAAPSPAPVATNTSIPTSQSSDKSLAEVLAKPNVNLPTPTVTQPATADPNKDMLESFKQFVTGEKKRLQPKKVAASTKAKDDKLAEMIKFSQTFKLKMPVPEDLLPLLTKDEKKQKDLLAGTSEASSNSLAVANIGAVAAASTSNTPQPKEASLADRKSVV